MADGGTSLLLGSLIVGAVGTGIQYFGEQQQANQAQQVADYNYQIAQQNAQIQSTVAAQQADWQRQSQLAQYQAQQNTETSLRNQASATEAEGREAAARERLKNQKILASTRANIAKSGLVSEGTPLLVLAETASRLELGAQDIAYGASERAKQYQYQADLTDYNSQFSLFDADISAYQGAAAETGYQIDMNEANLSRFAGYTQADNIRTGSIGTLISGFGDAVNTASSYYGRKNYYGTPRAGSGLLS